MTMTETQIQSLAQWIEEQDGVVRVRRWAKGGHDRLYIRLESLNGSKYRRPFEEGCRGLYVDLQACSLVIGRWTGARTRKAHAAFIEALEEKLEQIGA